MRIFVRHLFGGAILVAAALAVGILHNSVRNRKIHLIPRVPTAKAVRTASEPSPGETRGSTIAKAGTTAATAAYPGEEAAGELQGIIPVGKAKALFDTELAVFIDARSEEAYNDGHIQGAINIPYDRLVDYYETLIATVPTDQLIICYCWSPTCDFSDHLTSELVMMGYENVVVFRGGWEEWEKEGYPAQGLKVQKQ